MFPCVFVVLPPGPSKLKPRMPGLFPKKTVSPGESPQLWSGAPAETVGREFSWVVGTGVMVADDSECKATVDGGIGAVSLTLTIRAKGAELNGPYISENVPLGMLSRRSWETGSVWKQYSSAAINATVLLSK